MSKIDVSKCPYKGGLECHIRDYPIEYCADVKIEDCHYKQLQRYKQAIENISKGNIGNCCCSEEYAMKIIHKCEEVNKCVKMENT